MNFYCLPITKLCKKYQVSFIFCDFTFKEGGKQNFVFQSDLIIRLELGGAMTS